MVGFAVMKTTLLLMLGLVACEPTIDANVVPIGPAQYAITGCGPSECYQGARATCPYGYDVLGESNEVTGVSAGPNIFGGASMGIHRDKMLRVQCKPPVFCADTCVFGFQCVPSKRYPGRNVCAI